MVKLLEGCMKLFKTGTTQHFTSFLYCLAMKNMGNLKSKCIEMAYKLYKLDN